MRKLLFIMLCFSCLLGKTQPTSFFTITDLNMPDGDIFINYVLNEMDSSYEAVYGFNPIGPSPNFNFVGVFDKEGHFTHNKYFGPINLSYVQLWGFSYIPLIKSYAITGSFDDSTRQMIWPMNFFMDSTWQLVGLNESDTIITKYNRCNDSIYNVLGYISNNNVDRDYFIAKQNIKTFEITDFIYTDSLTNQFTQVDCSVNKVTSFNQSLILSCYTNTGFLLKFDENKNLIASYAAEGYGVPYFQDNHFVLLGNADIYSKKVVCLDQNLTPKWEYNLDSTIYNSFKVNNIINYQNHNILVISEVIDSTYIFTVLDTNGTVLKEVNIPQFHHDSIGRIFRISNGIETSDGGLLLQVRSIYNEQWAYLMKMDTNFHVLNSDCNFYILSHYNTINEYVNEPISISLFPNPTTSHFTIQSSSAIKSLTIYNLQGQQLLQKSNLNANIYTIEEQLPKGVYVVKVETQEGVEVRKVLVE